MGMDVFVSPTQQRKKVRDKIEEKLTNAFANYENLEIFKQQRSRAKETSQSFINIFFHKGEVRFNGDYRNDVGHLVVRFATNALSDTDDVLDSAGLLIEQSIEGDITLDNLIDDIEISSWQYGQDEQTGFSWLGYVYKIKYETAI
jgi:hypothetical protein